MIPVKVQCSCGQRYAFDVEPINGRVPSPVACPVCGADGTAAANEMFAQALAAQPISSPPTVLRVRVQAADAVSSSGAALPSTAVSTQAFTPRPRPPNTSMGKDGVAGAVVGLFIALGGYGAVLWWIHDRKSVRKFEILIAFAIGAAPGFILQNVLQRILRKRALS